MNEEQPRDVRAVHAGGAHSSYMYQEMQKALSALYAMKYEVEAMGGEFRGYSEARLHKNGDYGEAQRYLLFEHDPVTQKLIHDEQGNMVLRKGYIQSGINCDPFTFNTECTELNRRFNKNQRRNEVKAHHYCLVRIMR